VYRGMGYRELGYRLDINYSAKPKETHSIEKAMCVCVDILCICPIILYLKHKQSDLAIEQPCHE